MNEPTNSQRASWAWESLVLFARNTGLERSGDLDEDPETVIGDFLADLLHLCRENGLDFYTCLHRGEGHFREEVYLEREDASTQP